MILIKGDRLKKLLSDNGLTQKSLSDKTGFSPWQVSRWCKPGKLTKLQLKDVKTIAEALNSNPEDISRYLQDSYPELGKEEPLTVNEQEWLDTYRALPPLQQARIRCKVDDIIKEELSQYGASPSSTSE